MSKILIEGNKVIIDGHSSDLETCNTLTNLCDELSKSDKFRTVKYESGYGEFESVSENEEKKFDIIVPPPMIPFEICSNDGTTLYCFVEAQETSLMEVTPTGMSIDGSSVYTYSGNKVFLGFSDKVNSTSATFPVGYTGSAVDIEIIVPKNKLYIVDGDPGYKVNVNSNDGTTILAQNATIDSVVVTSVGAQLKCGDTVNATYTYAGSKLFAGLATSSNATAPKYKPGDTIKITGETTLYIVENIIIPEHHSSLTELFTNIATVIREKTGDTASIVADDFPDVIRERLQVAPPKPYLTFRSPNSFTLAVGDARKHWDGTLEYSTDASSWSAWDGSQLSSATSGSDNVLYIRGTGNTVINDSKDHRWVLTGTDIKCIGNIENLLDYATVESGKHPTMKDSCYSYMFLGCTALTQAPALPATRLTYFCYGFMFYGCTGLTHAPELPATTLADYCYRVMFSGCTSLTQAPALPATTLAESCYESMFYGCTSLAKAPALPATTLANSCYQGMFYGCTGLTQAPDLPATTLANSCYGSMFYGCAGLTHAPELPATTLANYCYSHMFQGCTALIQAPALPATTLANSCYGNMFYGCTGLTQAPELPATTLADYCYWSMFYGCTSLAKAPALPATTLAESCYESMFSGCTSLSQAPSELPATRLANNCYEFMFEFTAITAIPRIMATTYATDSCKGMFDDIKTLNVYSSPGPGHEYGWTAPASTYCSVMFGSDDGESEWAKLDGSNFPNSGTPTEGVTYYFAVNVN